MRKRRIPFLSIANRLTGFSTPVFGVSWNPPALDVDVARELVTRLEDRRVLFYPANLEEPKYVAESVIEMRHLLTEALVKVDPNGQLGESLRAMRAACRRFLDNTSKITERWVLFQNLSLDEQTRLAVALGELRAVYGIHLGRIAVSYGINVDSPLAQLLPERPTRGD